jgi:hypothetical protein
VLSKPSPKDDHRFIVPAIFGVLSKPSPKDDHR